MDARICLRVSNQKAYVWNVDDIARLRSEYRICGMLIGTLPHLSQQNVFLGVPLILMPEEVVLLVDKQLATIVDDPMSHREPTVDQLQRWSDDRNEWVAQQIALGGAKDAPSSGRAMTEAAIQKRKEREEKKARAIEQAAKAGVSDCDRDPSLSTHTPRSPLETPAHSVVVPAESSSLEWYDTNERAYSTIAAARGAGIWTYPDTLHERARCGVFRGLWELGYFLGSGSKFGGDYLVYPGDPLRYHSHFVASVFDAHAFPFFPMELVAHGRLGTATKKAHLLCGWDDEQQTVTYFSIEWAGFG